MSDDLDPAYGLIDALHDIRSASIYFATLVHRQVNDDDAQGMASDLNAALAYLGERDENGDLIDWRQRALDAEADLKRLTGAP